MARCAACRACFGHAPGLMRPGLVAASRPCPMWRCRRRAYTFGNDTAHDIVAAASADALVAVHGAGCTNVFYMGEDAALLEIR